MRVRAAGVLAGAPRRAAARLVLARPAADGLVHVSGAVAGGHEYECIGYDTATDRWEFVNSWGTSWGKAGHFFYTSATFARLLSEQGDATVFVPITQPAPVPTPAPAPAAFPAAEWAAWKAHPTRERARLVAAVDGWLTAGH
jgi:hypothetical protein